MKSLDLKTWAVLILATVLYFTARALVKAPGALFYAAAMAIFAGAFLQVLAAYWISEKKGRSSNWSLIGLLGIPGIIILLFMPAVKKEEPEPPFK